MAPPGIAELVSCLCLTPSQPVQLLQGDTHFKGKARLQIKLS